ncbi:glycosyltransferase family 2 protein [Parapedobacter sp. 10938]|uniref:glycosyltransferase family 2 protein n=1 Tax=Parapedobacter flavus TaxID=3110225 RepID=UPI002DB8C29F|nr:glycosyltransferase family 2 protein [Parapedobacter sp. 10938]MEC3879909.1 glycosyltransferase family 2 protein [Parapedobacter sp. 10938]
MTSQPLISVIIPTFNRAHTVLRAINSVLDQRYRHIQLIVVDDGSTDGTRALLESKPGIEYIYQDNAGQAAARNTGMRQARGTLISSLDSDDYWTPGFLEVCVGKLRDYDADFVFTNWNQKSKITGNWEDFLSSDPFLCNYLSKEKKGWFFLDNEDLRKLYLMACPSPSSSVVLKRSSMVGGWNCKLNIGDDWGLYLDMILAKPCKAVFTLERLWYKDLDGQNIYDGRAREEVVKLLLVEDTNEILIKYRDWLTLSEQRLLEQRYVAGLVEFGKYQLTKNGHLIDFSRRFVQALSIDVKHTLITAAKLMKSSLRNGYQRMMYRMNYIKPSR